MNAAREATAQASKLLRESLFTLNFALKEAVRHHTVDLNTLKDDISAELETAGKLRTRLKLAEEDRERVEQTKREALERQMMRKSELEGKLGEGSRKRVNAGLRSKRSISVLEDLQRQKGLQRALELRTLSALSLLKEITHYVQEYTGREDFTVPSNQNQYMQELGAIQQECRELYAAEQRFQLTASTDPRQILPYTRSTVNSTWQLL